MHGSSLRIATLGATAVLILGCGGEATAPAAKDEERRPATPQAKVEPYTYAAPVKGHYEEVNTGTFDLVDGLAYPGGGGTVVYVTSKPIASPLLSADCPMAEARALTALRNAAWLEVTLDAKGNSSYFAAGTPYAGQSRETDVGGGYWQSDLDAAGDAVKGFARHKQHGGFEFELPLRHPAHRQLSQNDEFSAVRGDPSAPPPADGAITSLYESIHKAVLAKDLAAALELQGFSPKLIAGVRGLAGIDQDLAVFADRFLQPGTAEETQVEPGYGGVGARGANSQGAAFYNFYQFESCGDRLILVGVGENPQ